MNIINEDAPKSFVNRKNLHAKNQKAHLKYLRKKKDKINNATDQGELPKYNQIGESDELLEATASSIKADYKPKGKKNLTDFKDIPLSRQTIISYKKDCSALSHVRWNNKMDGCILLDGNTTVVGFIAVEEKNNGQKWLQALEITKNYRGYGLSKPMIHLAVMHYGARYLSVNKNNKVAIRIYEDLGFRQYSETDTTVYMSVNQGAISLGETTLLEAVSRKAKPVFIISSWTNTAFGKLIKIGTQSTYTHSGISLDSSLEKIYTFNADNKANKFGGVSIESLQSYIDFYNDCLIEVSCVFIKESDLKIIKAAMEHMTQAQDKTTYDFLNILNIIVGRAREMGNNAMTMVCSQFVAYMLSKADIYLVNKPLNLITPKDLVMSTVSNPKVYLVYEGLGREYNSKKVDKQIRQLKQKAYFIKEQLL